MKELLVRETEDNAPSYFAVRENCDQKTLCVAADIVDGIFKL
jgi:hypothetical protein